MNDMAQLVNGAMTAPILKIVAAEKELLKLPQANMVTTHHFAPGLYARALYIPKNVMLTGAVHKHDDIAVVAQGDISILSNDGWVRVRSPFLSIAKAGTKRLGYAHEDTVYITFHATDETDILKLDEELFHNIVDGIEGQKTSETRRIERDREDFQITIKELGFTPESVREISEISVDRIDVNDPHIYIDDSPIEGKGVFSSRSFMAGEEITVARIGDRRTEAGRYMNHSAQPNCIGKWTDRNYIGIFALRDILPCEELTNDYRLARKEALT